MTHRGICTVRSGVYDALVEANRRATELVTGRRKMAKRVRPEEIEYEKSEAQLRREGAHNHEHHEAIDGMEMAEEIKDPKDFPQYEKSAAQLPRHFGCSQRREHTGRLGYRPLTHNEVVQEGDVTTEGHRPAEDLPYPDEEMGASAGNWSPGYWVRKVEGSVSKKKHTTQMKKHKKEGKTFQEMFEDAEKANPGGLHGIPEQRAKEERSWGPRPNPKYGLDILSRLSPLERIERLTQDEFFHEKDEFGWGISLGELRAIARHMRLVTNERDFFQRAYGEVLTEKLELERRLRKK